MSELDPQLADNPLVRNEGLPPFNLVTPDPACDLDIVAQSGRDVAPLITLSNSFGFGGINAALIFRHPDA